MQWINVTCCRCDLNECSFSKGIAEHTFGNDYLEPFPTDDWTHLVIVAFVKLFVTQLIYVLFLLNAELFPTPVRSTGFAWLLVSGFAAMSAAPYILNVSSANAYLCVTYFVI